MFKKPFSVLLALACGLLSACSGQSSSNLCEVPAPQSCPLTTVLEASPDEVEAFSYSGNALYSFYGGQGIFSKGGDSAAGFVCPNTDRRDRGYLEQENALVRRFAEALADFSVDAFFVEDVTEKTVLPQSEYIMFSLSLSGDRYPEIILFETGELYVTRQSSEKPLARHYSASRAAYSTLKQEIADIRAELDALPLDYQTALYPNLTSFKPESTALRLSLENLGAVSCAGAFIIERQENGAWRRLSEKESAAPEPPLNIPPRGAVYHTLDLTRFEGGQQPGRYRVTGSFSAGAEQAALTADYEISADAFDISRPYKPAMTPENQAYYDQYLSMWGFYCPFERDYDAETFAREFRPYLLYASSVAQEGRQEEYGRFGVDIPASIVDGTVTRHFPLTVEQFRAGLAGVRKGTEYYDPQSDSYHFEGGYGGGSMGGVVTHVQREGDDILKLSCDWYGMDDAFYFSHTVTIRLGTESDDFCYIGNTVTKQAAAD